MAFDHNVAGDDANLPDDEELDGVGSTFDDDLDPDLDPHLGEGPIDLEDELDVDDDDEDDDDGEEEEDGDEDDGDEGDSSDKDADGEDKPEAAKKKSKSKKRKGSDEDEEIEHPNTPIPTQKVMRAALDHAFAGQDDIDDRLLDLFTDHAIALLEANRLMNVTSIIDPAEIAVKHYLDSWRVTRMIPLVARRILDLGSGGGFPGLPVAMAEPDCSMILCEAIGKKAKFLEEVVKKLGLKNVRVVHMRAEEYLATERVDLVLIRAVSSARENVRTLRKVRHSIKDVVMLKGNSWGREVRAAEREAERLGFKLDTVMEHELPEEMGKRALVVYRAPGGEGL
jgi:16S rRNA (guanine527-N7)-methyltransferase